MTYKVFSGMLNTTQSIMYRVSNSTCTTNTTWPSSNILYPIVAFSHNFNLLIFTLIPSVKALIVCVLNINHTHYLSGVQIQFSKLSLWHILRSRMKELLGSFLCLLMFKLWSCGCCSGSAHDQQHAAWNYKRCKWRRHKTFAVEWRRSDWVSGETLHDVGWLTCGASETPGESDDRTQGYDGQQLTYVTLNSMTEVVF